MEKSSHWNWLQILLATPGIPRWSLKLVGFGPPVRTTSTHSDTLFRLQRVPVGNDYVPITNLYETQCTSVRTYQTDIVSSYLEPRSARTYSQEQGCRWSVHWNSWRQGPEGRVSLSYYYYVNREPQQHSYYTQLCISWISYRAPLTIQHILNNKNLNRHGLILPPTLVLIHRVFLPYCRSLSSGRRGP